MLIGIPPILGPDLLYTLRSMGHGDEIAIVDGNYPALEHAKRLIRADGHGLLALLEAILVVFPLDQFSATPVLRASEENDPAKSAAIHHDIDRMVHAKTGHTPKPLSGDDIYPRIRLAHTIIATSEDALYANVLLRKGVITSQQIGSKRA